MRVTLYSKSAKIIIRRLRAYRAERPQLAASRKPHLIPAVENIAARQSLARAEHS